MTRELSKLAMIKLFGAGSGLPVAYLAAVARRKKAAG